MSQNSKLVSAYAKSLFQTLKSSKKKQKETTFEISKITASDSKNISTDINIIGEELLLLRAILISSNKINNLFKNPTYVEQQKANVLFSLFPGLSITTKSFLKVLTERNHLALLPEISDMYQETLLKFQNSVKVKVILASPLSESFGTSLNNSLKTLTKANEIFLTVAYNPKLLGGLIIEYNSFAIDASILKEFSLFFSEI